MVHITSLPPEILRTIFGYIDSTAQLASCRLVCRVWNYPAEQCMFGKEIHIKDERQAIQLYTHLCKNPSNGNLIKHLNLTIRERELPLIYEYLMDIAFTPTIETLNGITMAREFFDILTSIADNYSLQFPNLKKLPEYPYDYDDYLNALTMKQLQASALSFSLHDTSSLDPPLLNWKVINLLDEFKNLKSLELTDYVTNEWPDVDSVLKKCHTLETLTFSNFSSMNIEWESEDVHSWVILHNVIKEFSLTTIEFIESPYSPELVEYLMYKYPNVTKFKSTSDFIDFSLNDIHLILNSLKRIQTKELIFYLPYNVKMYELVNFAESRSEEITFKIDKEDNLFMKIT